MLMEDADFNEKLQGFFPADIDHRPAPGGDRKKVCENGTRNAVSVVNKGRIRFVPEQGIELARADRFCISMLRIV